MKQVLQETLWIIPYVEICFFAIRVYPALEILDTSSLKLRYAVATQLGRARLVDRSEVFNTRASCYRHILGVLLHKHSPKPHAGRAQTCARLHQT